MAKAHIAFVKKKIIIIEFQLFWGKNNMCSFFYFLGGGGGGGGGVNPILFSALRAALVMVKYNLCHHHSFFSLYLAKFEKTLLRFILSILVAKVTLLLGMLR